MRIGTSPTTSEDIADAYEKAADEMEHQLARIGDDRWAETGRLYFNGKLMMERPVGEIIWDFFFDAIHHRAS